MRDRLPEDRNQLGAGEAPATEAAPTIDGYTIERELGRGGEAIVYLAREENNGRRVAIKVLRPELAESVQTGRFAQEIRVISDLVHPNILPLLHFGRTNGLLYYVSPYVDGESLRRHIQREGQLRIGQAVRIVREVTYALDYASRTGIVHRDIKPENILLADGHAFVADFGVARALTLAGDARLTAPGLAVGTPAYMSPEQAGGEARIDGRSDIYSLGCVLYELLVGSPPFDGTTPHTVFAKHLAAPVPSLRLVRPSIPQALEDVVLKALAKTPADRYESAAAFGDALAVATEGGDGWRERVGGAVRHIHLDRLAAGIAGAALLVAAGVWALAGRGASDEDGGVVAINAEASPLRAVDPAHYRLALYAVDGQDTIARRAVSQLMRAALKRWTDVAVEDEVRVAEALGQWQPALRMEEAQRIAKALGVGRYVRLSVDRASDSLAVSATLYETGSNVGTAEATIHVPSTLANVEPAFAALADSLLLAGRPLLRRSERVVGTRSVRAREAYLSGHAALVEWDLPLADSLFDAATRHDREYAQALLWLAQLRSWRGQPVPLWRSAAVRANARRQHVDPLDTIAADALVALADGRVEHACRTWKRSTEMNSTDFAAWYGYANCLRRDDAVIPDATRAGAWRFRSSYNAAIHAYQRAFQLLPSVGAFSDLAHVLRNSNEVRPGRALPPDTTRFRAYPAVEGDSIVYVPFTADAFNGARAGVRPQAVNAANLRYRELYRDIALTWRSASPGSSGALEAVATSLDLFGDETALDTLLEARRLASTRDDKVRLAALEVWMRIKSSVPNDRDGLLRARAVADSVLAANPPGTASMPRLLSSLAALTGRANLAAAHARAGANGRDIPHGGIARSGPPLLAFAALGGPADSIRMLSEAVERAATPSDGRVSGEAARWLLRAAATAFPEYRAPQLRSEDDDYLVLLQLAFLRGDTSDVRHRLAAIREGRRAVAPASLTFDGLYPEAAVLHLMGDHAGAAGWLDPTLRSFAVSSPRLFLDDDAARAGPFVRTLVLRAELASRLGDSATARRYADAVGVLWSDADAFLNPTLNRMKSLSR